MEAAMATSTPAEIVPFQASLAALIESEARFRKLKSDLDKEKDYLDSLKEVCKEGFENMGVSSMKTQGKTVYIARQFWAGTAEGLSASVVVDELKGLGLDEFVSYNHMSFSAYVRETAKQHPELVNDKGDLIGTPEQIVAVLPGNLANICKVTEKLDLKIRKS